jgi:hypothetical protein
VCVFLYEDVRVFGLLSRSRSYFCLAYPSQHMVAVLPSWFSPMRSNFLQVLVV